jgi:hypothetical protein
VVLGCRSFALSFGSFFVFVLLAAFLFSISFVFWFLLYCGSGGYVVGFCVSVYCVFLVLLWLRFVFCVCFTSVSVCATAVFYAFCCGAVLGGDVVGGGAAGFPVVVVGCGSSGCEMGWLWCLEVRRW